MAAVWQGWMIWNKIHPQSFAAPWIQGCQALCLQDSGHSAWQQNMLKLLKTRFYSNYFTHHGGSLLAKIFIEPVITAIWNKIHPQSCTTPWIQGYQASCLQDSGHSAWKQNILKLLKTRFYSNCFTHQGGTNPQGSQELIPKFSFTCRQFDVVPISKWLYVRNLKTVCWPLPSDFPAKIQPVNFTGTRHLATTLVIMIIHTHD